MRVGGKQIVGGFGRGARRLYDGAIILAQNREPGADVIRMTNRRRDAE